MELPKPWPKVLALRQRESGASCALTTLRNDVVAPPLELGLLPLEREEDDNGGDGNGGDGNGARE